MRFHDILLTICSCSCLECIEASCDNDHYGVCICTQAYVHSCIHTYTYIHTYIHTYGGDRGCGNALYQPVCPYHALPGCCLSALRY